MEDTAIFRPAKRRKFIRQHETRAEDDEDEVEHLTVRSVLTTT